MSTTDFKAVYSRVNAFMADNDVEGLIRYSGEGLALAGEKMKQIDGDDRKSAAIELLAFTTIHCRALIMGGMGADSVATAMLSLIYLINSQINPEDLGEIYIAYLQELISLSQHASMSADEAQQGFFIYSTAMLMTLFATSCEHFMSKGLVDDKFKPFLDATRGDLSDIPDELIQLTASIRPQMALDVASAVAAAMRDAGATFEE